MARPQLVSHWRLLWRAWSTRFMALVLAMPVIVETMPENIKTWAETHLPALMWAVTSLGLTSRYVKQFDLGSYVKTTDVGVSDAPLPSQLERKQVMSETSSSAETVSARIKSGLMAVAADAAAALPPPVGPIIGDLLTAAKSESPMDIIKAVEDIATALDTHGANAVNTAIATGKVMVTPTAA